MSANELAVRVGKTPKAVNEILHGKCSITPDTAVALECVTKIPAYYWLNRQKSYDEYIAREKQEAELEAAGEWAKAFPLAEMIKRGYLPKTSLANEKVKALLSFFGVCSPKAWEDYYYHQQLKVTFRISLSQTKEPFAISAWLREGELRASAEKVSDYSEKKLKDLLPKIKELMTKYPVDFLDQLKRLCSSVGVKVQFIPCLPKAPINGATRWLNDLPFVQISDRYKRYDAFCFTFFHEIGHILLHGKKEIFLEDVNYSDCEKIKEDEADYFASNILLSKSEESEFINSGNFSALSIRKFAKQFKIHPAFIIGRLHHLGLLPYQEGTKEIPTVDFINQAIIEVP